MAFKQEKLSKHQKLDRVYGASLYRLKLIGLSHLEDLNYLSKLRLLTQISLVLDRIVYMVKRHVSCDEHTATAVALWIVFTWCIKYAKYAPILYITAPEMRCGKSELLELISKLCMNPEAATGHTASTLFHLMNEGNLTLIIDEADTFLNKDGQLVGILNKGYQRGAYIPRMAKDNKTVVKYSIWGAKAIAGIGLPKATIKDRSIMGVLQRKLTTDKRILVSEASEVEFMEVKQHIRHWAKASGNAHALAHTKPEYLPELNDRANTSWRMLFVIADLASPEWGAKARRAAIAISGEDEMTLNQELFADIERVFQIAGSEKLSTKELVKGLLSLDDSRWARYKSGRALTNLDFLTRLKPFGLRTKSVRGLDGAPTSGFALDDFKDTIARYVPTSLQSNDGND